MTDRLAALEELQSLEMEKHYARWYPGAPQYYHYVVGAKQMWIDQRWELLDPQYNDFMELYRVPVELSHFSANKNSSAEVGVVWRTESQEQVAGFILYSGSDPDQLNEIASWQDEPALSGQNGIWEGADYQYWDNNATTEGDTLYYELAWENMEGSVMPLNWRLALSLIDPPQLYINEFLAVNNGNIVDETGEFEDWLELYNAGPGPADLGGLFLTDDLTVTTKWQLPEYHLEAGEHLIIWSDSDPEDGPWHTSFKLNGSGEEIGLFTSVAQGNVLLDSVVFGPQKADVSLGRQMDGAGDWVPFFGPTPGSTNDAVSASPAVISGLVMEPAFPNPFNPRTEIRCFLPDAVSLNLGIYDIRGEIVCMLAHGQKLAAGTHTFSWDGTDTAGRNMAAGVYFARLTTPGKSETGKLVLVR